MNMHKKGVGMATTIASYSYISQLGSRLSEISGMWEVPWRQLEIFLFWLKTLSTKVCGSLPPYLICEGVSSLYFWMVSWPYILSFTPALSVVLLQTAILKCQTAHNIYRLPPSYIGIH